MRASSKLAVLFVALTGTSVHAATLIPVVPVPGSTSTFVEAINDENIIAGDYATADGSVHGFYGTLDGQYTTFDFDSVNEPGTQVRGINNQGDVTGVANLDQGNTLLLLEFERFANGSMTLITHHRAPLHGVPGGINSHGVFAAEDWHEDASADGYSGKNAKAKSKNEIELGFSASRVRPRAVTNSGDIVGYFRATKGYEGFLQHDGTATVIDYPDVNALATLLQGANSSGVVSGIWEDQDFNEFAFYYNVASATFTPITIPGFPLSTTGGVNRAGLIALNGFSSDFSQSAPYVFCPKKRSNCPAGGTEIADAKPVRMPAGGIAHRDLQRAPKPLTPAHAAALSRQ